MELYNEGVHDRRIVLGSRGEKGYAEILKSPPMLPGVARKLVPEQQLTYKGHVLR